MLFSAGIKGLAAAAIAAGVVASTAAACQSRGGPALGSRRVAAVVGQPLPTEVAAGSHGAGAAAAGPSSPPASGPGSRPPSGPAGRQVQPPAASLSSPAPPGVAPRLGPWLLVDRTQVLGPLSDQGLATVRGASGTSIVYRGSASVTARLRRQGWDHVGDPDAWEGWIVDAFQGGPGSTAKMFRVTSPSGRQTEVVHHLVPGETGNNSFAAVSPDGQWTLSGEWGTEWRLLVFPTPVLNPAGRPGSPLPLAGVVLLARPVRNLQGCAFATPTRLLCTASDPGRDLWPTPDQLLQIDLAHALSATPGGSSIAATVGEVGELPLVSPCQGTYEPEGIDLVRPDDLRVEVTPPGNCDVATQIYEYRLAP